jgi:hypothetical protein
MLNINTKNSNFSIKQFIIKALDIVDKKLLFWTILSLLLLLCLYIMYLKSIKTPTAVPIVDFSESNIIESIITTDDQHTYYSSKFDKGSFKGSFTSPWYLADKDFAIKIGGWLGHNYIKNNAHELQLFIEDSNNKIYNCPQDGVNRLYYNTLNIYLAQKNAFKFRIITKGDSFEPQGWLSFSAPYYPESDKKFSNFLVNLIELFLKIFFILSFIMLIYCKTNKLKFLLLICGLSCYLIIDYTPVGIVPFTPNSQDAQRIFITNDGAGYYLYLQEMFIENYKTDGAATNVFLENGGIGNVYPIGVALLESPFFLIARSISDLAGLHHREGLNDIFQLFSAISSAFYFLLGTYFLYKIILKLTNKINLIIVLLSIIYGTNLLFYASGTWGLNYTHIYSFALISLFLYVIPIFYSCNKKSTLYYSILIGILIGIITMTRLQNCTFVLVFLLYDVKSFTELKLRVIKYTPYFIISCLISLVTFFPQMYWWYTHTGKWLINLYGESGGYFNWTKPELLNFTFSVHKGLFFWTPLWLLACLAIWLNDQIAKKWRYPIALFLLLKIYICASWWWWSYGGSFGQREFADLVGLLAICLTIIFNYFSKFSNHRMFLLRNSLKIFIVTIVILVIVNLIYLKGIISGIIPFDYANKNNIYNAFKTFFS